MTSSFQTIFYKKFAFQAASIYGGEKGLYDLLPSGEAVMNNLIIEWRKFFVINDEMLSIQSTMLTPEKVLKASGHVEKFNDFMVKDLENGDFFRADHLVEKHLETLLESGDRSETETGEIKKVIQQIDNYGGDELGEIIKKYNINSPEGNKLSEPSPMNLMFETSIGPGSKNKGYLRPETAQGIFINFNKLLEESNGKLPFAAAQVGFSFRNEISPRSGLIRVREFQMAEIEHFLDPLDKSHEKFIDVQDLNIIMFSSKNQMQNGTSEILNLGEAVREGVVANETLGYFIGRIYLFLVKMGVDKKRLRFRQHMPNEMAHYACDCWDAELLTHYGWIECVGCADRSAYDLKCHSNASGIKLVARRTLEQPKNIKLTECKPKMNVMGKSFRGNAKKISNYISNLSEDESENIIKKLTMDGKTNVIVEGETYEITKEMIDIIERDEMIHTEQFVPNVIEPSFGLGRIFYALMEHNFAVRKDDEERTYFTLPPILAPIKFSILPLSNNKDLTAMAKKINQLLKDQDIFCKLDTSSASIGKRYARTDQIGIPFGVTVDFDSINISPNSVTVRERDSMKQIRVNVEDLPLLARELSCGRMTWEEVMKNYQVFEGQTTQ